MPAETTGLDGLAERYAGALFDLAIERRALDDIDADLASLRVMLDESAEFRRMIRSPVLSRAEQAKAIDAVADKAQLGTLTRNFLGVAANNRRLFALDGIIAAWRKKLADHRGEVTAEVTSAEPLSDNQRAALDRALAGVIGGRVSVETRVDPSLIGGLIVRIGSRMVDSSLRTKLQRLQLVMKGAG